MHPEVSEKNTLKIERIDSEVIVILCRVSAYRCLKSIKSGSRHVRSEATKPPLRGGLEGVENSPQQLLQAFLVRRRRDSNPRNVAVQQFSRLPPSTTRPHLHVPSFLNRAAKIGIISKPAKLSEGAEVMKGSTADYQKETDSGRISNKVRSPQSFPVWTASTRIVVQGSHLCFNSHVAF